MISENKVEDPQKLEERLEDLRVRWEAISALAATKQDRSVTCPHGIYEAAASQECVLCVGDVEACVHIGDHRRSGFRSEDWRVGCSRPSH